MIDKICQCGHSEKYHVNKIYSFPHYIGFNRDTVFWRCNKCFELGLSYDTETHWHPFKQDNLKTLERAYEISK